MHTPKSLPFAGDGHIEYSTFSPSLSPHLTKSSSLYKILSFHKLLSHFKKQPHNKLLVVNVNPIQVTAEHHSSARGLPNCLMLLLNYCLIPEKNSFSSQQDICLVSVCHLPHSLQYKSQVPFCQYVTCSMLLRDNVRLLDIINIAQAAFSS